MQTIFKYILILLITIAPSISFAYTETTSGGQLSAGVYPDTPGPYTEVFINLISYEVNLEQSNIKWIINGKKQQEGIGQNKIKLTTGPIGKKIIINIEVISRDGKDIKKQISIIPAEVDILWQSSGYTPPFYPGKSLTTLVNSLKLIAVTNFITENGTRLDPKKLIYVWKNNAGVIETGYGKQTATTGVSGSSTGTDISLEVSSPDGILIATKLIRIKTLPPQILLYETNPLLGNKYEKAILNNFQMNKSETTFKMEPYFFNTDMAKYSWGINNEELTETLNNKPEITLRQSAMGEGEAILTISANYLPSRSLLQTINIKFGRALGF